MSKIPFDIKYKPQIESGEYKVETRDGKKVRMLCYDANNIVPIVALVSFNDGSEGSRDYYSDGTMDYDRENPLDLFIVTPDPELTPFEDGLRQVCEEAVKEAAVFPDRTSEDFAKAHSAKLLSLAEKEIAKGHEHDVHIPEDTYYEQLKNQWEDGYDKGKTEALKDLPRWRAELADMEYVAYGIIGGGVASEENPRVYLNGHSIDLYSLEKLPGFKED